MTSSTNTASADGRNAANDNLPVFDRGRALPRIVDKQDEWTGARISLPRGIPVFRFGIDLPSEDYRIRAGQAWYSSNRFSGQHDNDNLDWPLAKLLRTERRDFHLKLAERYRDLWEAACGPWDLRGKEIGNDLYTLGDRRLDESTGQFVDKGEKTVTGKKAQVDVAPKRALAADPDKTKKRAKPIPRAWHGDLILLHCIDAKRELEALRTALGPLRADWEDIVCHGSTLEAVGKKREVGNKKGAAGAGRLVVNLGLDAVDQFWQQKFRRPVPRPAAPDWQPGEPVPEGYYLTRMYPGTLFRRTA